MGSVLSDVSAVLPSHAARWVVTGVAGFIGSHLLEALLKGGQSVVGVDNFSTGSRANLDQVAAAVSPHIWSRFQFIEGDVADLATCHAAVVGADYVLHHAALGSVPRSIADPLCTHQSNVNGFLNMLIAARDAGVKRFVYAASSSTYGDEPSLPKREDLIGAPLSPYAVTKYVNELYAHVFALHYGMETIGLRYFNVFGPRQDPHGAYAAVIPTWFSRLLAGKPVWIHGDGLTTRDFLYVQDVVQANFRAAQIQDAAALHQVYNIGGGVATSLNALLDAMLSQVRRYRPDLGEVLPEYRPFVVGDIRHSVASIDKAQRYLGYVPSVSVAEGLAMTADYYAAL